jgi:hypothetical protein
MAPKRSPPEQPPGDILLSWAGLRSKKVAGALRVWIPHVIQVARPWFSETDIQAGAKWFEEIEARLRWCKVSIIPLTLEAMASPWLNFEAGGVFKAVDGQASRVCVLLLDGLRPADISGPLVQFQHTVPDQDGIKKVLWDVRNAIGAEVDKQVVEAAVDRHWDLLAPALTPEPRLPIPGSKPVRTDRELLEELLQYAREANREEAAKRRAAEASAAFAYRTLKRSLSELPPPPPIGYVAEHSDRDPPDPEDQGDGSDDARDR